MKNIRIIMIGGCALIMLTCSCKKFLSIDSPSDQINTVDVYSNDETASAAIRGIYSQMMSNGGFASGSSSSVTLLAGRSSDDFINFTTSALNIQFSDNNVTPVNSTLRTGLWQQPYQYIYYSNAVLENLERSPAVSSTLKHQLNGEAKFIRAFCHFYLTNLFGNVPLILTTDYRLNSIATANTKEEIYAQIIKDLTEAKKLLSDSYPSSERIRVNKSAATAFLARVYLYNQDWKNAETQASEVISRTEEYKILDDLNMVFLKTSKEAILQFAAPLALTVNTFEGARYILAGGSPSASNEVVLSNSLLDAFEPGDKRLNMWVGTFTNGATTLKYPLKYKIKSGNNPYNEYSIVLRLAEQYLIRAEACINQNRITEGVEDLNVLRKRARALPTVDVPNPLPPIPTNISIVEALSALEKERRIELFSEWGHRWMDLKRTNKADIILAPFKGLNWQGTDVLYPIPANEILNNPNLNQNQGYE